MKRFGVIALVVLAAQVITPTSAVTETRSGGEGVTSCTVTCGGGNSCSASSKWGGCECRCINYLLFEKAVCGCGNIQQG